MQYAVPQFVGIEDRIIGSLTGKQILYLIIGGGTLLIFFTFFDLVFFALVAILIIPTTVVFAFYKPSGRTVATYLLITFNHLTIPHTYIWQRELKVIKFKRSQKKRAGGRAMKENVSHNKLRELAWVLDTSQAIGSRFEVSERK